MRSLIIASILLLAPALAPAAGGHGVHLEDANIDLADQASLQRGAKYFVNYCMGCHSLKYMRYNRMAADIGLDEVALRQNLILDGSKPGDLMTNSMRPEDGEKWFGTAVPDLTLVTRWRGPDWVYTYLKSFYKDESRPYGVNNLVFPEVGMPHVLSPLQGLQNAVYEEKEGEGGETVKHIVGLEPATAGSMGPEEYDAMVRDLTNFLAYAGEPMKLERKQLGIYVLLFFGLFFILAYALKKEYWKDIH
jgi:ubiquinol-cytochrome c reductase cytochrome c1 subunit